MEGIAWFYLAAYSKILQKRDKWRNKLLSEKEPALNDFESSQPPNSKKWKVCSGKNIKDIARHHFATEIRCECDHGSNQPSQQKRGIQMNLFRKDLWSTLLSNGLDPHKLHRRLTSFLRMLYQHKYFYPGLKGRETG